jgi:murein DD-endopeptidase MepM/ murein hydrolase activator NlpD
MTAADPAPVPPPRAPWVAHRVVTDAVAVPGGRRHIVKAGETGIAIARAYGVAWSKVVAANHLKAPYTIEIGDALLLPSAKAVAAQTPAERARAFQIDIDDLITGAEPAGGGPRPARVTRPVRPAPAGAPAPRPADTATTPRPPRTLPPRPLPRAPVVAATALPIPILPGGTPTFAWPLEGRIVSAFGPKPGGRFNDGVNLRATPGTPVRAAADGVVAYAGDAVAGFGNLVLIKHADGWVSAYGHNEALLVARGQAVRRGDIVARSGATGAVDEPQLHFEVRRGRTPSDPVKLLPPR